MAQRQDIVSKKQWMAKKINKEVQDKPVWKIITDNKNVSTYLKQKEKLLKNVFIQLKEIVGN